MTSSRGLMHFRGHFLQQQQHIMRRCNFCFAVQLDRPSWPMCVYYYYPPPFVRVYVVSHRMLPRSQFGSLMRIIPTHTLFFSLYISCNLQRDRGYTPPAVPYYINNKNYTFVDLCSIGNCHFYYYAESKTNLYDWSNNAKREFISIFHI